MEAPTVEPVHRTGTLLDDGAWTLAQSGQAIDRAAWLREQTRELILTYRPHRFRAIRGSNDLNDARRRAIARALALQPTKTFAGLSHGGTCMVCGQAIKPGEPEYEIEAAAVTMTLDADCYTLFEKQITKAGATSANDVPHSRRLDGLTVLVVDDHADTVEMVEVYLTASGASVLGCGSAKAALALAESRVVDAALVDLRMPGEDGRWLLRQLRASRTASAQTPLFVVSGEQPGDLGPTSGFAGYFIKPVDLDEVVAALAALPRRAEGQ